MSLVGISGKMGTTSSSLEQLLAGKVPVGVSSKIGVTSSSLQKFVDGGASVSLASKIGCTSSTLQDLRDKFGEHGAIGLLIGLCICEHEG